MAIDVSPEWVGVIVTTGAVAVGFWKWADNKIDNLRIERAASEDKIWDAMKALERDARDQERRVADKLEHVATKDDLKNMMSTLKDWMRAANVSAPGGAD